METPEILDYTVYNHRMNLSMVDKLFFIDKINSDLIVDFGCADGFLLKTLRKFCPEQKMVGYDNDPKMARMSVDEPIYSDWSIIEEKIKKFDHPAIILSSVLHEVYHYGNKFDIDYFWRKVFDSGFEFIILRDMVPSRSVDRPSNINDVKKILHKFLDTKVLNDFQSIWGSIENNKQLIHFLLKYKYLIPNWERECRENYIPISREDLLSKIPSGYDVIFHEHYVLPYIWQTVMADVGIEIKDPTHLKLILKKQ